MSDLEILPPSYAAAQWSHWRPTVSRLVVRPRMSSLLQHAPANPGRNTQTAVPGADELQLVIFRRAGPQSFSRIDRVDIRFRPRPWSMFILPAHCTSFWDTQPEIADGVLHIQLDKRLIAEAARDQGSALNAPPIRPAFCADDAFLSAAVRRIDETLARGPPPRLMWDHFAGVLAAHLVARESKGRFINQRPVAVVDWRLRRAVEYIEARLGEDLGIDDLSAAIGVSATHLTNVFRAGMGQPPHQWIMQRRFERACEMLLDPYQSITAIAHRCGFSSSQHLATVFQKRVGMSPSAYRRERLS